MNTNERFGYRATILFLFICCAYFAFSSSYTSGLLKAAEQVNADRKAKDDAAEAARQADFKSFIHRDAAAR